MAAEIKDVAEVLLNPQAKMTLEIVFAGAIGKFIIDAVRKGCAKLKFQFTGPTKKWIIRGITIPISYVILFIYGKVTGQGFDAISLNAVVQCIGAALLAISVNEILPKDKVVDVPKIQ